MIKEAIQYLVGLKDNKTYQIDGKTYSDNQLHLIEEDRRYRKCMEFAMFRPIPYNDQAKLPYELKNQ